MRPDRSNYQIWLIDWLDGTLEKAQVEQLLSFLEENPDLKEEAESLSLAQLSPLNTNPSRIKIKEKSFSDLPGSQIEYLSVAYLEKDLSAEQNDELQGNIAENTQNRSIFESIQKIRLVPQEKVFMNKKDLFKLTPREKIIRISITSLSVAATIASLILSSILIPQHPSVNKLAVEKNFKSDTGEIHPFVVMTKIFKTNNEEIKIKNVTTESTVMLLHKNKPVQTTDQPVAIITANSSAQIPVFSGSEIAVASVFTDPDLNIVRLSQTLLASNNDFRVLQEGDDRNNFSKFVARTFREKLLKENNSGDDPVKAYEIAEAGIDGLNNLLGWNMDLVATNDEAGSLKSVYFSSGLLKFNAPVKKEDTSQ